VGVAVATFVSLVAVALTLATCRRAWKADFVEQSLRHTTRMIVTTRWYLYATGSAAAAMVVLHVARTDGTLPVFWDTVEMLLCLLQSVELLIVWAYAVARSTQELFDIAFGRLLYESAMLPSVLMRSLGSQSSQLSLSYFASLRLLHVWRHLIATMPSKDRLTFQLADMVVTLFAATFCIASLMAQVEMLSGNEWDPLQASSVFLEGSGNLTATEMEIWKVWSMSSSFYFMLASVSTVGYGDLAPRTTFGRLIATSAAVPGAWLVLKTFLGISQALSNGLTVGGSYGAIKGSKHAVVAGTASKQVLSDFISELYHEDHETESEDLNLVILVMPGQREVIKGMKAFLRERQNARVRYRVWLLQGTALLDVDLRRAHFEQANMGFLLPNLYATDPEQEDLENCLRAMNMRRYAPHVRMVALLLNVSKIGIGMSAGLTRGDIICVDEMKHGMMGKSCETPGFLTMACTLYKSANNDSVKDFIKNMPEWFDSYMSGLSNEIYEKAIVPAYFGAPFSEVAVDILVQSEGEAYLVGVIEESLYPGDEPRVLMFPGNQYRVGADEERNTKGIFVARERTHIKQFPGSGQFPWSLDQEDDGAAPGGRAAEAAPVQHPHAVPVQEPRREIAGPDKFGWVEQRYDLEEELKNRMIGSLKNAAARSTSQGLRTRFDMDAQAAQRLVEGRADRGGANRSEGALKAAQIQADQAVRDRQREEALILEEQRARKVKHELETIDRAVAAAEAKEEDKRTIHDSIARKEKEDDDELWGWPCDPPKGSVPGRDEPPIKLLLRGGHVLVISLGGGGGNAAASPGAPGRRLGLHHFVRALRTGRRHGRPVVLVAAAVPLDWAEAVAEGEVYIVTAPPLSSTSLMRGGIQQASAVVIHQVCAADASDPSAVDAETIFACHLADSMVKDAGGKAPVICDLMLEKNAPFISQSMQVRESEKDKDKIDDEEEYLKLNEENVMPFIMQMRFVLGQMFTSTLSISLAANMLYNRGLASIFREMMRSPYVILPMPVGARCNTFGELVKFFVRKKNRLPMALVRRNDVLTWDEEELEDEIQRQSELAASKATKPVESADGKTAEPAPAALPDVPINFIENPFAALAQSALVSEAFVSPAKLADFRERYSKRLDGEFVPAVKWSPEEPHSQRHIYTMPEGSCLLDGTDGILCVMPPDVPVG